MPSNYTIAKQLKRLGDYLAICGCDEGQFAAAAFNIQSLRGQRVDELWREQRLHEVDAVNEEVAQAIEEICLHGTPGRLDQPIGGVPLTVMELVAIPGLGAKTARRLWSDLGIDSLASLNEALASGQLDTFRGIGPKMRETIRRTVGAQETTENENGMASGTRNEPQ